MKTQFDAIIEGQKKAMSFWANMAEQMNQAIAGGMKSEITGDDLMKEWLEKQQSFFKDFSNVSDPEKAFQNAPEQLRKWMEWQTAYAEKWLKFYQQNAEKMGWKMPELDGFATTPQELAKQTFEQWKAWLGDGASFMPKQVLDKLPNNMKPHFKNFIDSYQHFYRHWEPILNMIKNGLYDQSVVEKYFSTDAYHKMVNQVMGYKAVGNVSEVIENVNNWFEKALGAYKEEWGNMNAISDNWRKDLKEQIEKGNLPYFEIATDLTQRMRDHLVPFENIMAQGRETEIVKLMRDIQFGYVSFLMKSAELQTQVHESGRFALPDIIRKYYQQYQETNELPDYQTFFNDYINQLEESILEVLHAGDYSQLQSEVSVAGARLKSMQERLLELWFSDIPFLTRTDGDDIARETTALRKKVRSLEQRIAALEQLLENKQTATAATTGVSPKKKLIDKIGAAPAGQRNDLKVIKGIGPKLEKMLNELGIYTYEQMSRLTNKEYELIDQLLGSFQGRGQRDHWAEQAQDLLATTA